MSNLHTPERLPGESFDEYRPSAERTNRRAGVKAAGGIRQYKRAQYRAKGWL